MQSTKVSVAGRSYPVRVPGEKVSVIQSIGREINDKVRTFQNTYKDRDVQDCLTMALLTYAMELEESEYSPITSDEMNQKLEELNQMLDSALS